MSALSSQVFEDISRVLERSKVLIGSVCSDIESANTEIALRAAFIRFNGILRIIRDTAPEEKNEVHVRNFLSSLQMNNFTVVGIVVTYINGGSKLFIFLCVKSLAGNGIRSAQCQCNNLVPTKRETDKPQKERRAGCRVARRRRSRSCDCNPSGGREQHCEHQ